MITRRQLYEWTLFALIALAFCLLLSLRPIPSAGSDNDTGRYVQDLHQYCTGSVDEKLANKEISYAMFYAVTSPACLTKTDGVFLFEVAAFLPLMFLLFAKWKNGTFLWASSLMFSVFGLELMTNAMRQGFATLLFFGAIALLQRHRVMALLLGLIAVAAHTSVLAFFPFLLWISGVRLSKKMMLAGGAILLSLGISVLLAFQSQLIEFIQAMDGLRATYSLIYADELKSSFILFMVLPLYWVYGVRWLHEKENISSAEKKAVIYSTLLLLASYFVFSYITYRFAIFAVALQVFLVTRSEKPGLVTGGYVFIGLLAHLFVMLTISNHFAVLIDG